MTYINKFNYSHSSINRDITTRRIYLYVLTDKNDSYTYKIHWYADPFNRKTTVQLSPMKNDYLLRVYCFFVAVFVRMPVLFGVNFLISFQQRRHSRENPV